MITRTSSAELRARITEEPLICHALETETVCADWPSAWGRTRVWGWPPMHDLDYPKPPRPGPTAWSAPSSCRAPAGRGAHRHPAPNNATQRRAPAGDVRLRPCAGGETVTGLIHAAPCPAERMVGMEPKS